MPTAKDVIKQLKAMAKKDHPIAIMTASEIHNAFDLRRPSGILSLDLATGGGLPAGGMVEIGGPEGTGKNFLSDQYMTQIQKIYGKHSAIAVVCFESNFDKEYARKCGVQVAYDDHELALINANRAERGEKPLTKDAMKEMKKQLGEFVIIRDQPEFALTLALKIIESNAFQLVLIDSWDALETEDSRDKDLDETEKVGSIATLQTRFTRKLFSALNTDVDGRVNETTIIALRQARANMSAMQFAKKWKIAGAHALRHANLGRILLSPGVKIRDSKRWAIGKEINWEIDKGKAGFHDGPKGTLVYYYDPPRVDVTDDFLQVMVNIRAMNRTSTKNQYTVKDGDVVLFSGTKEELKQAAVPDTDLWEMGVSMAHDAHNIHGIRFS